MQDGGLTSNNNQSNLDSWCLYFSLQELNYVITYMNAEMEVLCRTILRTKLTSPDEYEEFVRRIEEGLDDADVLSVEVGEVARIKLKIVEDTYDERRLAETIGDINRVEHIKQVEKLAE